MPEQECSARRIHSASHTAAHGGENAALERCTEDILIARPYAPMLFRQGIFPGPHLLMEYWRGIIQTINLERAWKDAAEQSEKQSTKLIDKPPVGDGHDSGAAPRRRVSEQGNNI